MRRSGTRRKLSRRADVHGADGDALRGTSCSGDFREMRGVANAKNIFSTSFPFGDPFLDLLICSMRHSLKNEIHVMSQFSKKLSGIIKQRLVFFVAALQLGAALGAHAEEIYRVEGQLERILYQAPGVVQFQRQKSFEAIFSDDKWWIKTKVEKLEEPVNAPENGNIVYGPGGSKQSQKSIAVSPEGNRIAVESGFDGDSLYLRRIFSVRSNGDDMGKVSSRYVGHASEAVEVFRQSTPQFDDSMCFLVWLAFNSAGYLLSDEQLVPPLIWLGAPNNSVDVFKVTSKPRCQKFACFFEEVLFENRGYFASYGSSSTDFDIKSRSSGLGYLAAKYQVSEWNTLGQVRYPKTAVLEFFSVPTRVRTNSWVNETQRISVSSFSRSERGVPAVTPTALTRVTDHRIETALGPLTYATTNRYIPTNDTVVLPKVLADAARQHVMAKPKGSGDIKARWLVLGIMAIITVAALWMIWCQVFKPAQQQQPGRK